MKGAFPSMSTNPMRNKILWSYVQQWWSEMGTKKKVPERQFSILFLDSLRVLYGRLGIETLYLHFLPKASPNQLPIVVLLLRKNSSLQAGKTNRWETTAICLTIVKLVPSAILSISISPRKKKTIRNSQLCGREKN